MENFEEMHSHLPKCVKCGETPLCSSENKEGETICCDCDRTKSDREAREKMREGQNGNETAKAEEFIRRLKEEYGKYWNGVYNDKDALVLSRKNALKEIDELADEIFGIKRKVSYG